jgi:hypothetical protein
MKKFLLLLALVPAGLRAEWLPLRSAWYTAGSLGANLAGGADVNALFSRNDLENAGFAQRLKLSGDLKLGWQTAGPFGMEIGMLLGPNRQFEVQYKDGEGNTTATQDLSWTNLTCFVAPQARWAGKGKLFSRPFLATLGMRLGVSMLFGRLDVNLIQARQQGGYDQNSTTWLTGAFGRFEQLWTDTLSSGMEIGYDYNRFNYLVNGNGSGVFSQPFPPSPQTNPDGSVSYADFSGLFFRLTTTWWFSPPYQLPASK